MSDDAIDTFKVEGLEKLIKALHVKPPVARVGIIGAKAGTHYSQLKPGQSQPKHTSTNAEIGAAHEFGTEHVPMRSFLRVPISENLQKEMESAELFNEADLNLVIRQGSVKPWLDKVAICAEACVQDAFDSGGNGKWPAWKDEHYSNNAGQLLVDTTQLRNSITSEVK